MRRKEEDCYQLPGQAHTARRLFITDLDGTLLNDQKRISKEDLAALVRMRREGISIALATGRSNYSLARLMESLHLELLPGGMPIDHSIFSTGAGILAYPGGRIIRSLALAPNEVQDISALLESLGLDYMIHKAVPETVRFLYAERTRENPDFFRRLRYYKDYAAPLSPEALAGFGSATEVLCIVPARSGQEITAKLKTALQQFNVILATSPLDGKSFWIEIFPPTVSKSQAAHWLAEQLDITRDHICAVGNDYNDEDLLGWAGRSFVVANSPESLRNAFDGVASNNHSGIAESAGRWLDWK